MPTLVQLRQQLEEAQARRAALEGDVAAAIARLNAPGQPGMHGSLIDHEGYPRPDIDVAAIRADRQTVIRLSNDHRAETGHIAELLQQLHAVARQG
jgi:26S proteasome non-ATPase regulatory subunit 9